MTNDKLLGSRAEVWHGTALKTNGGLTKKDLKMKNHRIISLKKSMKSMKKKNPWMTSVGKAKKILGMEDKFVLINSGPDGIKLYKKAKEIHSKK
jgi:hypothetical protein